MPEAVTTQHETLWIGVNRSAMVRVPYVVSSPEIADPVQPIDATNLASDARVYIPGIKDYSGDLVWEANSQYYRPGELRDLLAMDGCHVYAERRMPMVGMRVAVEGEASVSMSAADPDGVQRVTVRIAPTAPMAVEEWSEDTPDGYLYRIRTDAAGMNILDVQAGYGGRPLETVITSSTRQQGAANIPHEWDFNGGVGPFGCWYGAFNIDAYVAGTESEEPVCTEAGRLAYRLDPFDLGRTLYGTELSGTYNIMLVVPTVYWKADGTDLYLSSAESMGGASGMVAYAHTATLPGGGTRVYPYIAIGVYEGGQRDGKLLSIPGAVPATNKTHDEFKGMADALTSAGTSDFQMMNFFQWTLTKIMMYLVMGTKNCQWMMGLGPVEGSASTGAPSITGQSATAGPYAQSTSEYDRVFIENAWGSAWQFVGDAMFDEYTLCAGNTLGGNTVGTGGRQPALTGIVMPSSANGYISEAYTTSEAWDATKAVGDDTRSDPAFVGDWCVTGAGKRIMLVGGRWTDIMRAGLCDASYGNALTLKDGTRNARLSAYLDDYAMGLTDEAPASLMSAPLTLSMGQSTPGEEEAEESEEPEENYGEEEETPEESGEEPEEEMR